MTERQWSETQERLVLDVAYLRAELDHLRGHVEQLTEGQQQLLGMLGTLTASSERHDQALSRQAGAAIGGGGVALIVAELVKALWG